MYGAYRTPPASSFILVLVAVAVFGYLIGHDRAAAAPGAGATVDVASSVLLESPPGWRQVGGAPHIPGLSVTHPVVIAPGGDAADAGLVTGKVAPGETTPLPDQFVARLAGAPDTQVAELAETQAYVYPRLRVRGFGRVLTIYAIPDPQEETTVLACYAPSASSSEMRTCQQVVAGMSLTGQFSRHDLAPNAGYARRLTAAVRTLDAQRAALRSAMNRHPTRTAVSELARRLAGAYSAAASLGGVPGTLTTATAQLALSRSLLAAAAAYRSLAAAASANDADGYNAACAQIYEAEEQVNATLESFALLGYKRL